RDLATDVPEFLQVEVLGTLGGLDSERGIAAGATAAGDVVLLFHLVGQCEERLEHGVRIIDLRLRDAVALDAREAPLAIRGTELGDERVAVAAVHRIGETADIEGGDARTHLSAP